MMVKIERSYPAPSSLKERKSYRESDVVSQLVKDFHGKCYICEIGNLTDIEVEHLLPHYNGTYLDRKFDWDNLFLSCGHCNGIKNSRKYDEKILDCCKVDPEERLVFKVEEDRVEIFTRNEEATEIDKMTAQLITEVFNLKNTGIRTVMCEKRVEELHKEMNILYTHLHQYKSTQSKKSLRIIKTILRRNSPFSAFKREYIRMNRENYFELEAIFSEVEIFC